MKTLPLPEIIAQIVKINGCEEKVAHDFLTEFAAVIEQALTDEGSVTIKGLGSFRRIEMADEVTVEFAPDTELSDAVNAPFAIFEPIELDDDMTSDMLNSAVSDEDTPSTDNAIGTPVELPNKTETPSDVQTDSNEPIEIATSEPSTNKKMEAEVEETVEQNDSEPDVKTGQIGNVNKEEIATELTPEETPIIPAIPPITHFTATNSTPDAEEPAQHASTQQQIDAEPQIRIIEKERVVEVPDHSHSNLKIAIASLLSLIAGLLIGYFAYDKLNFSNVQSVSISADDVKVYHQPKANIDMSDIKVTADTTASSDTTLTEPTPAPAVAAPTPKPSVPTVVTDTIKRNRFLTTMALQHYGKKKFWVYIYEENRNKITDPDNIPANTVVVIPPASKYGIKSGDAASEADAEKRAVDIKNRKKQRKS